MGYVGTEKRAWNVGGGGAQCARGGRCRIVEWEVWKEEERESKQVCRSQAGQTSGQFLGTISGENSEDVVSLSYRAMFYFIILAIPSSNCVRVWIDVYMLACVCCCKAEDSGLRTVSHQLCTATNATGKSSQTLLPLLHTMYRKKTKAGRRFLEFLKMPLAQVLHLYMCCVQMWGLADTHPSSLQSSVCRPN